MGKIWPLWVLAFGLCLSPTNRGIASPYSPTPQEIAEVDRLTGEYFAAMDRGDYTRAYAMCAPQMRELVPLQQLIRSSTESAAQLGELLSRTRTKATWEKDPPDSSGPGVYVAFNFVTGYENAKRNDEYVIWYRPAGPTVGFQMLRHEATYVFDRAVRTDTPSAAKSEGANEPAVENADNSTGFKSVAAARATLTARTDVNVRNMPDGWLVVDDSADHSTWSFVPPGHPAYPAVVKRNVSEHGGKVELTTSALCEARKSACDRLIREFQAMNQKLKENLESSRTQ